MVKVLDCGKEPCSSCPYRKDVPSGLWDRSEYEKLPGYDENATEPRYNLFLCHQTNAVGVETVCRGWLSVTADSIAVRLAIIKGEVTVEQRDAPVATELWGSGTEASVHGLKDELRPGRKAIELIQKLEQRGAGKLRD